jgi:hypothetical protein
MNDLTSAKSSKIDDRKWFSIHRDTTPFPIIDFRLIWRGEIIHFIVLQPLSEQTRFSFHLIENAQKNASV